MKKRAARTVLEVCAARQGVLKGARTVAFISQWIITANALGHPVTVDEYAEWWGESRRTVFRDLARFRECFPHLSDPQPIADQAIARAEALQRGVKGVGSMPASLVTA